MAEQIGANPYDLMRYLAQTKARELQPSLPPLPDASELSPIREMMWIADEPLIHEVRQHMMIQGTTPGHAFEDHVEPVAVLAAFVADQECHQDGIVLPNRDAILQRTWRAGLLHDIERHRGFGKEHMVEGAHAATLILADLGIDDPNLPYIVSVHDDMEIPETGTPDVDIPTFSLFAADHIHWGFEWAKDKWDDLEAHGVPPHVARSYYRSSGGYMERLLNSPNLLHTAWGRNVARPYIEAGISIARAVESELGVGILDRAA
jgi:hypothetical protein